MRTINAESRVHALLGLCLLSAILVGAYLSRETRAQSETSQVGRYQVVFNPHSAVDKYLVDTATGRLWSPAKFLDYRGEPTIWRLEERADTREALVELLQRAGSNKQ